VNHKGGKQKMKPAVFPNGKVEEIGRNYGRTANNKTVINLFTVDNFLFAALFFLFGRATLMDGLMPFAVSAYGAAFALKTNKLLLAASITLGLISKGNVQYIYISLSGILLLSIIKLLFSNAAKKQKRLKYAAASAISTALPEFIMVYMQGFLLYDLFMCIFHIIITFLLVLLISKAFLSIEENSLKNVYSNEEALCLGVTVAIALTGLTGIQIFDISVKAVTCILIILLAGNRRGVSMGAATGVMIGFVISMSSSKPPVLIGVYGICGLLCGVFNIIGRIGSGIAFISGNFLLTLYINGSTETLIYFKEILCSIIIFLLIPQRLINRFALKFAGLGINDEEIVHASYIKDITIKKLNKFSKAFLELSKTFGEISETSIVTDKSDISTLFDRVADRICKDCSLCGHCWERNFYETYQLMFKIVETLDSKGRIDQEDVPVDFINKCRRINDFIDAVNNVYELFKIDMVWKNRLGESRGLVSQQLYGLSKVISNLAADIDIDVKFKSEMERRLISELAQNGINVESVYVTENKYGKYEIQIKHKGCGYKRNCINVIAGILTNLTGRKMAKDESSCCMDKRTGYCEVKFLEEERFSVTTGIARLPKHGSMVSGDNYSFMNAGNGKYLVALSDGMGSGQKAATQSKTAISLLEQFMDAGFDKDTAVNLINSILVLKSSDESFTTIDLTIVDLYDGEAEFLKIGAVPTFVKREDAIETIRTVSLPAGIFSNINTELVHKKIDSGNFIIMMTDGIIDAFKKEGRYEDNLINFIRDIKTINPQVIADMILDEAYRLSKGIPEDDMTVLVAKVWKKI